MAEQKIKLVIQLRRDYAANWEKYKDIVPAQGEPCFVIDQNILKIGDGVTSFDKLEPINSAGVDLASDGKSIVVDGGILKLMGYDAAEVGAQPQKTADGIKWVVPVDVSGVVEALKADVEVIEEEVNAAKEDIKALQADATSVLDRVAGLEYKMDGTGVGTVDAKIEAKIKAFEEKVTDNGTIDTIQELIKYVAEHGGAANAMANDIAALKDLVGTTSVQDQIDAAVAGKVDKVEGMGLSSNDFSDSLLGKLEAIEPAAQVNTIEKISIGGSVLDIVDKTIEIPVASADTAGLVKSSTGANKVNVANDGTMSMNKVSVNSLFVPIGDELILDGGSAYKGAPVYSVRIGNMGCNSISDAVAAADNGDVITMQEDINMGDGDNDHLVSKAENVTIDLCGKELVANGSNGAVKVEGGMTTLEGTGAVKASLGSDKYSMAVWAESGKVVINDGFYSNSTDGSARGTDLIYASGTGCIEINGGTFEAAKPEWTLNVKDVDYKAGTAKIIVKGGKFKNFDPANNNAEGAGTNFVAENYKSVKEGDYYVVKPI
jgi:hypothetical protein